LHQGDYAQETVFSEDPVGVAMRWQSLGAPRLHVVDLDGAAFGELVNLAIIREIAASALVPIQVGGGIRQMDTIKSLLKAGVDRVILGTAAVENPELVRQAAGLYGEAVAVSIDARDGKVAIQGWKREASTSALALAGTMKALGVRRLIYTDITRDGTLTEPNFSGIFEMVKVAGVPVIASGGIACLNHLIMLRELGVEGVIIGKALYTGAIKLKAALAIASG